MKPSRGLLGEKEVDGYGTLCARWATTGLFEKRKAWTHARQR